VNVNVTMRILSISSVSEVMMDFTADFYFRQTWVDPRLRFTRTGDITTLYVGAEVSKRIWLPDTFFGNEKMAYFHEATTPNVFLRIDHTGEVYRSIRLTVTSSCPMKLQYFPMDRQQCTIEAESYGYNVKDIIYRWARSTAVERDKTISLPQFDIIKTEQKTRIEELSSGTYSRLVAEIHFARRMGYYLIQIYIPSSLIVVISWVSFWLHRNASPARVQLGVTTVLTMTTLMSSTNAALPKISYVKSIDVFLGTCFVMVFAALLEYATVGYLGKRIAMRKAHAQNVLSHAIAMTQRLVAAQNQANLMSATVNQNGNNVIVNQGQSTLNNSTAANQPQQPSGSSNTNTKATQQQNQPNVVEQFLNTAASMPMNTKFDKRGGTMLTGPRLLDGKLPKIGKAKQLDSIFGVRPSSIDKYSRVVFPVCFVCFQLMYWIVYLHISAFLESDAFENK
jgi:gamma-aminobutyric acid receptor subunit beta